MFFVFLYFLTGITSWAMKAEKSIPESVTVDSLPVYQLRQPDEQFMRQFRDDPAFNYKFQQPGPGIWYYIRDWIWRHLPGFGLSAGISWLGIVLKITFALLLLFLIYRCIRVYYRRKTTYENPGFQTEDILLNGRLDEVSYPGLVQQAVDEENYVLAVRIHYLYILRLLDAKGFIHWDTNRTNWSYYYEIREERLQRPFGVLVRIFEYVCYGEFQVDKDLYKRLSQEFNDYQKEIMA